MIYLLDSNVCIVYLKGKNEKLKRRLEALSSADIAAQSLNQNCSQELRKVIILSAVSKFRKSFSVNLFPYLLTITQQNFMQKQGRNWNL